MKRPPLYLAGIRSIAFLRAFTLLELLTVMTIIAVLAGLILSGAGYAQQKAARDRATSEIAALSVALESFKADNGEYPQIPGTSGASKAGNTNALDSARSAKLYAALSGTTYIYASGTTSGSVGISTVYFEPKSDILSTSSGTRVIGTTFYWDPFGNPYGYASGDSDSIVNGGSFDLWSTAGSGSSSTTLSGTLVKKWVTNWGN